MFSSVLAKHGATLLKHCKYVQFLCLKQLSLLVLTFRLTGNTPRIVGNLKWRSFKKIKNKK